MNVLVSALSQQDVQSSLVQGMVQGEQQWLVSTIAAFLPGLWTLSLILHVSRPYMVRMIRKLSLRFAADVWWLSYVLVRDAVMTITFALTFIFFLPNFARNIPLPITGPIAGLFLFWALLVKLTGDVDDNPRHYRIASIFMVTGAALWLVPEVVAVQSTSQGFLAPLVTALTSTQHPDIATGILAVAVIGLGLSALYVFNFAMRFNRSQPKPTSHPQAAH